MSFFELAIISFGFSLIFGLTALYSIITDERLNKLEKQIKKLKLTKRNKSDKIGDNHE